MVDKNENVDMIEKFLENFIFSEVPYELDYSVGYNENYGKYVIGITITVDASKMFFLHKNFDKNYQDAIYRIEDDLDSLTKYLGIPYNLVEIYVDFDYINYKFLDDEAERLEKLIDIQYLNTFDLHDQSVDDIGFFVYVRKSPEDSVYYEIEVGCNSDTLSSHTAEYLQNYVYDVLEQTNEFPHLRSIINDGNEISFWFF